MTLPNEDNNSFIKLKDKIDENNILQEDILFNSPSYAAAFVIGGHINGPAYWKDETGKALKDLE